MAEREIDQNVAMAFAEISSVKPVLVEVRPKTKGN